MNGDDLQKELDLLRELLDKIKWTGRWDSDEYKELYVEEVLEAIGESKKAIRELIYKIG